MQVEARHHLIFFVGVIVTPALLKSLDQACELLRDPKPEHLAAKPDTLADLQKLLNARHYQLECSKSHFNSKLFCPTCNESMDGRFARNPNLQHAKVINSNLALRGGQMYHKEVNYM
jgi:hypothetical protein